MKKRVFSFKLYLEGLRQTKLIGIMAFIILTIQTIAIPIGRVIELMSYNHVGAARGVSFIEVNPLLYTMIYIVAPLLALCMFSFLNKRKSSDFYHSIADTRICLFVSFFAAVYTWIVGISVVTTLIGMLTHGFFPQYFTLNITNIWLTTLNILVSSLYSASAVTLAMTLTGTLVTNIAVTGLILIFPDYLVFVFKEMVLSNIPIVPRSVTFGDALPVGFNFLSCNFNYSFTNISNAIVTLVLAIVLSVLALVIFKFRKSESAGYPALNKYLQAGIRIAFCMVICIFACGGLFILTAGIESFDSIDMFAIVMIYIVALVVYFLYEIITTKKFKTAFRTAPALLIVILLNVGCVIGMNAVYNSYLSFQPSASEIDYITVDRNDTYVYDIASYLEIKSSEIRLKNDDVKNIISNVLSENIVKLKNDSYYDDFQSSINVTISVNGIRHQRCLVLNEENFNSIQNVLEASTEYKNAFLTLPDAASVSIETYGAIKEISNKEAMRIYNLMRKEVAECDFNEWYAMAYGSTEDSEIASFHVTVIDEAKTYYFYIPLYTVFTESANEYVKAIYDKKDSEELLEILKNPEDVEDITITFYNTEEIHDIYYSSYGNDIELENIIKISKNLEPCNSLDSDGIYCRVNAYDEYSQKFDEAAKYNEYDVRYYSAIFKFTGDPQDIQ